MYWQIKGNLVDVELVWNLLVLLFLDPSSHPADRGRRAQVVF